MTMKASPEVLRHLSKVDELIDRARSGEFQDYSSRELKARAIVGAEGGLEGVSEPSPAENALNQARNDILEAGRSGLEKLHTEGMDADLTPAQNFGLEAIVLLSKRPAILVQRGTFLQVPPEWGILNTLKNGINKTLQSVGRIEVTGHPSGLDWLGTGFLVGENVVMTNHHVAGEFCSDSGSPGSWRFKPNMTSRIDYLEEFGVLEHAEFEFVGVIGIHQDYDLALLQVKPVSASGAASPQPLTIASQPPASIDGRQVFACGYPAWDGRRNDPVEMMRIFAEIFNVKRLQPGELRKFDDGINVLTHDCSTLGGNSGSCVVDLETNQVVGLHFGGRYLVGNNAVALWRLTNDPLLKSAKVNFD
jgi:endonuclease G, mitochondrial